MNNPKPKIKITLYNTHKPAALFSIHFTSPSNCFFFSCAVSINIIHPQIKTYGGVGLCGYYFRTCNLYLLQPPEYSAPTGFTLMLISFFYLSPGGLVEVLAFGGALSSSSVLISPSRFLSVSGWIRRYFYFMSERITSMQTRFYSLFLSCLFAVFNRS